MNRSFRLVWNAALGLWVVASELVKGKSKAKNHSSVCKLKSTFAKGLFSAGVGFISLPVVAIDLTWVGGENGAWDELSSWDTGSLPTENDDVDINSGTAAITSEAEANAIDVGHDASSSGSLIITGIGSTLSANGEIVVGYEGEGSLEISDGARVEVGSDEKISIASELGSIGRVIVTGVGSALIGDEYLYVGMGGEGTLEVSDGATVEVDRLTILGSGSSLGSISSSSTVNIGAAEGETAVASGALLADYIEFDGAATSLIFNHTDTDYELTADLNDAPGSGRVFLYAGTTSFTGDLTSFYGTMTVDGGTLYIAAGKTLELRGNYMQTSAGVLKVGASSNSNYGKLAVAGTATFAANSAIAVDVASANSLAVDGTLSSVVSADTLEASTFSVTDNSALFDFSAVVNDDTVDLVIVQGTTDSTDSSNVTSVTRYVTEQGHASSMGAAAMLDTFVSGGTTGTDMDNVVTALGQLSTGVEVSNAVAQTLPLLQGATNQVSASVTQTTSRVIQTRQAVTSGTSSGDGFITDKQGWVKVIGSSAKQDELNGSSGFESKSYGVIGGIDGEMNANSSMGIALSYVDSSIESTSTSSYNSAEIDSYQVAFYGQYALGANYHNVDVSWQADLGLNQTEGFRDITFMNREADSSYDSYAGHVGAGVGRIFSVAASTALVPSLRADYYYVHNESYTESGAGALNLEVESSNAEDFILTLQGDLQHEMNDQLFISASLGIGYDMMNDAASLTASYVGGGTTFTTAGLEQSPWIVTTGLAMNYSVNDTAQITASYDVQGREGFLNQTVSAKVKWLF